MTKKLNDYLNENVPDVIKFIAEEIKLSPDIINSIPALGVMLNSLLFIGSRITLQRFRNFLKILNFELNNDLVKFFSKISNEDVKEFLHDSARKAVEEKSDILRKAVAIHTAIVIKNNQVNLTDIKIFRSFKDLSDLEIRAFLFYLELDYAQSTEETTFRYSSNYDQAMSEKLEVPMDQMDDFIKELFDHLKALKFFNGGSIVLTENGNGFLVGRPNNHFHEMIEILKKASVM